MNNYALTNQLHNFIQSIPHLWSWHQLLELYKNSDSYKEYRGPEDDIIFTMDVVDHEINTDVEYLQILVSISEVNRSLSIGSSYKPLGTSLVIYKNGESGLPTESEIYDYFNQNT